MDNLFHTLPLLAVIWIIGTVLLVTAVALLIASLRLGDASSRKKRESIVFLIGIFTALWIILGMPASYIAGGSEIYYSPEGVWVLMAGVLGAAFLYGVYEDTLNVGNLSLILPLVFVFLAAIPLFLIAFAAGAISIGIWFWIALAFLILSLISFLSWGIGGLVAASPALVFLLIALT